MDSLVEKPITILVVEDHDDSRRMMQIMLELDGFRVITASTGRQAIDISASATPDVVLMDVNLPDMDGMAVTRQIRQQFGYSHLPIIALTAYDTSEARDRALAAGCTEFMLKPVNFERLEALFCRLLATGADRGPESSVQANATAGKSTRIPGYPSLGSPPSPRSRPGTSRPQRH
jgi:CheY-like chemotaxis protein